MSDGLESALRDSFKVAEKQLAEYRARVAAKDRTIDSLCEEKGRLLAQIEVLENKLATAERRLANATYMLQDRLVLCGGRL